MVRGGRDVASSTMAAIQTWPLRQRARLVRAHTAHNQVWHCCPVVLVAEPSCRNYPIPSSQPPLEFYACPHLAHLVLRMKRSLMAAVTCRPNSNSLDEGGEGQGEGAEEEEGQVLVLLPAQGQAHAQPPGCCGCCCCCSMKLRRNCFM